MTPDNSGEQSIIVWLQREIAEHPGTDYARYVVMILSAIQRGEHRS